MLNQLIEQEQKLIADIQIREEFFKAFQFHEKYELSLKILNKLIHLQSNANNNNISLIESYAIVRFILETLIQTELLIKEPKYTFQMFYSIYQIQLVKCEKAIERIKHEMKIMEVFDKKDQKITDSLLLHTLTKEPDIQKKLQDIHLEKGILDKQAEMEFTVFTNTVNGVDYKNNGYAFTAHLMAKQILPKYESRLEELKKSKNFFEKYILSQEKITELFDFKNQSSKVFSELKDSRSWKNKANEVNLEAEYNFTYDLSSSVLHSTSYSFFTDTEIEADEFEMVKNLIYKYSLKTIRNIELYLDFDKVKNVQFIEIE